VQEHHAVPDLEKASIILLHLRGRNPPVFPNSRTPSLSPSHFFFSSFLLFFFFLFIFSFIFRPSIPCHFLFQNERLGAGPGGVNAIKAHPFFKGIDWENLRSMTPPIIPGAISLEDAFPEVEVGPLPHKILLLISCLFPSSLFSSCSSF
jgi:hypothetical protein